MRLVRADDAGALVHVARWQRDGSQPEVTAPEWDEVARLRSTLGVGLPEAASALLPPISPAARVEVFGRTGTYEGSLITRFDGVGLAGEVVELRRPIPDLHAHAGTTHDHGGDVGSYPAFVDAPEGLFWLDRGRGECLRPVPANMPSDRAARGEAGLLLWPEGLPLLEPVDLVRDQRGLWLLDSGLRRKITPSGVHALGLDPVRARAVTSAELDGYPLGPPVAP